MMAGMKATWTMGCVWRGGEGGGRSRSVACEAGPPGRASQRWRGSGLPLPPLLPPPPVSLSLSHTHTLPYSTTLSTTRRAASSRSPTVLGTGIVRVGGREVEGVP